MLFSGVPKTPLKAKKSSFKAPPKHYKDPGRFLDPPLGCFGGECVMILGDPRVILGGVPHIFRVPCYRRAPNFGVPAPFWVFFPPFGGFCPIFEGFFPQFWGVLPHFWGYLPVVPGALGDLVLGAVEDAPRLVKDVLVKVARLLHVDVVICGGGGGQGTPKLGVPPKIEP